MRTMKESKKRRTLAVAFGVAMGFFAGIATPVLATERSTDEDAAIPADAAVFSRSQADWSLAWWQWNLSFSPQLSPASDASGARCAAGQEGDVWFLAGPGIDSHTSRDCTIPFGKTLLVPLAAQSGSMPGRSAKWCPDAVRNTSASIDSVRNLRLEVDGRPIANLASHRQKTDGCTEMAAANVPLDMMFLAATDGYYVMLKPLDRGKHLIQFSANDGSVEVRYSITVK